ncbi:MAG: hypothetical protein ACLP62_00075 [Acidimicrobiales bacterium]
MPLLARSVAAAVGGLLVLATGVSVVATLIVPRPVGGRLTGWVNPVVAKTFRLMTSRVSEYRRRDRLLAWEAAATLITQLIGLNRPGFDGDSPVWIPHATLA